ncbi:hypothetical protein CS542_08520 [Pedobacter sp. IW39]|nr:hypothetical protein CS542_08520 [Pedobacter sp. IW39]
MTVNNFSGSTLDYKDELNKRGTKCLFYALISLSSFVTTEVRTFENIDFLSMPLPEGPEIVSIKADGPQIK